jgi:hypothetical protein
MSVSWWNGRQVSAGSQNRQQKRDVPHRVTIISNGKQTYASLIFWKTECIPCMQYVVPEQEIIYNRHKYLTSVFISSLWASKKRLNYTGNLSEADEAQCTWWLDYGLYERGSVPINVQEIFLLSNSSSFLSDHASNSGLNGGFVSGEIAVELWNKRQILI